MTRPICGTFVMRVPAQRIAKAVLAEAAARMNDHPVPDQGMQNRALRADRTVAPDTHARPDDGYARRTTVPDPISAPGPTTTPGSSANAGLESSRRMHHGRRAQSRPPQTTNDGRSESGKQSSCDGDEGTIGLTDREHGEPRGAPCRRTAGASRQGARAGCRQVSSQVFRIIEKT